jgi:hypothetical protein
VTGNRGNIGQGININYSDPFDFFARTTALAQRVDGQ